MFDDQTRKEIAAAAEKLNVEAATLLAVAEVESGGTAFALVNGRQEPLIRFEGHYFDRRLTGKALEQARQEGLANPKAGAVANPRSQAARWALLSRATQIDAKSARESVSWGVGQVMGAHWNWLDYATVDDLVAEARHSVAGQVRLMARYIDKAGLAGALRQRDWAAFARGYNGPDYARHGYHTKIAAAYARYAGSADRPAPREQRTRLLANGMSGPDVLDLQTMLAAAGYPVARDAIFGLETANALRRFQSANGLAPDGIAGPLTMTALAKDRSGLTLWQWVVDWLFKR